MIEFSHIVYEIIIWLFLIYSGLVFVIFIWIGLYALGALKQYRNLNTHTDYNLITSNSDVAFFSVIAPAYNEGVTIVDNVRSLLSLYYNNLEIIIVNDGSKDDSIQKLTEAYDLELVPFFIQGTLPTKEVRGVYKSKNAAFKKLIVVDKVNGGKADALNVGINVSSGKYLVCIDVDCILEQDALLKLAKPFFEQTDRRVIACGGVIRLANNCNIENGKVVDINLPKTWLGRFQAIEYIRAFILGRMAWSRAKGLILISGAFGVFDKEIVLACGGYDPETVGEDMELVVRMRRYMEEQKLPYKVVNIPDPLCWTEVPESDSVLRRQRNRWMRGTMETLWKHRKLMFNPRYGRLGMVSMPYWFFFEFLGPIIEFTGYIVFILLLLFGIINWPFFFALFALVLASGILYSIYAILVDLLTDQVYTKGKDLMTLLFMAVMEPFFFHGKVVMASVGGARDYFRKNQGWGEMKRQGFRHQVESDGFWKAIARFLYWGLSNFAPIAFAFLILFMITIGFEAWWYGMQFKEQLQSATFFHLIIDNLVFALQLLAGLCVFYLILGVFAGRWSKQILIISLAIVLVLQFVLFLYFAESRNLLGADLFFYSVSELEHIMKTSGMLSIKNILLFILIVAIVFVPLWLAGQRTFKRIYATLALVLLGVFSLLLPLNLMVSSVDNNEFAHSASLSKWRYFLTSSFNNYLDEHPEISRYVRNESQINLEDLPEYAFLRNEDSPDVLGPFFNAADKTPNLVVLIIEGLGHAYSSPQGYVGNFTPFIDSLSQHSLTWSNTLSTSGRTFSVLPSLLGSLPFAQGGFMEQKDYPQHFNLFNVLKHNNFKTGFFYGGDASFDYMKKFITESGVEQIIDQDAYDGSFRKLPSKNGESWGFEDQAVLTKMLQSTPTTSEPYFNVLLTLSTHSPFLINNASHYEQMFEQRLRVLKLPENQDKLARTYKNQLVSVLNMDDALREFFEAYKLRSDFENTIFVITGDHSMPEILLHNKIDRYHVPLVVYSPLLNSSKQFKHTVSHFDFVPSILAYYRNNYQVQTPTQVTWVGNGLQEDVINRDQGIPIMQSKSQMNHFVFKSFHLADGELFKIENNLIENALQNQAAKDLVNQRFSLFRTKNQQMINTKELMPREVYQSFFDNQ